MNEEDLIFFQQEMKEQSNYEDDVIDWDDCSFGGTEVESYDP